MSVIELSGPYVGDGAIAARGGRVFVAFKPAGQRRNVLHELNAAGAPVPVGPVPGNYYNEGGCSLAFDDLSGELLMLAACSDDPKTGGGCRPILWHTGIVVKSQASTTIDQPARDAAHAAQAAVDTLRGNLHKV